MKNIQLQVRFASIRNCSRISEKRVSQHYAADTPHYTLTLHRKGRVRGLKLSLPLLHNI